MLPPPHYYRGVIFLWVFVFLTTEDVWWRRVLTEVRVLVGVTAVGCGMCLFSFQLRGLVQGQEVTCWGESQQCGVTGFSQHHWILMGAFSSFFYKSLCPRALWWSRFLVSARAVLELGTLSRTHRYLYGICIYLHPVLAVAICNISELFASQTWNIWSWTLSCLLILFPWCQQKLLQQSEVAVS